MNSKKRFTTIAATTLVLVSMLFGACKKDSPTQVTDPNLGKKATITLLHALSDAPSPVTFTVGDTTVIADTVAYGTPLQGSAQIGPSVSVTTKSTAGQNIGTTITPIDASKITWVIFTGLTFGTPARELINVTVPRPTVPSGKALVRLINVSPNAPTVDLRLSDATGAKVAAALAFKQTGDFVSVDTTVTQLVITANQGGAEILTIPVALTAGKIYSVVLFGSKDATNPTYGLRAPIVAEP